MRRWRLAVGCSTPRAGALPSRPRRGPRWRRARGPGRSCRHLHGQRLLGYSSTSAVAGRARRHAAAIDGHAHGAPARPAGLGRGDRDPQPRELARAPRRRCAGRPRGRSPPKREHARAAHEDGLDARSGARRARRPRPAAPARRCRRTSRDRPRGPRPRAARRGRGRRRPPCRSIRARPMHEPRPSETSTSPAARGGRELAHADHGLGHHQSPRPRRVRSSFTPPLRRDEQEGDRAVLALDREVGVEHERDVVGAGAAGEDATPRSRRACRSPTAAARAPSPGRSSRRAR